MRAAETDDARAEVVVPEPVGEVVTALLMRVSLERGAIQPRITPLATYMPLPPRTFGGWGEIVIRPEPDGRTRVQLAGRPPGWPPWRRRRWADRTLRRLLGF